MRELSTDHKSVCIPVGGVLVQLRSEDDAIARMTLRGKDWEPATRTVWSSLIHEGCTVLDVGAYTGVYSIASVMMGAYVVAFEPHPANFARLQANAAVNSVRVVAIQAAVSDRRGAAFLHTQHQNICDTASLEPTKTHAAIVPVMCIDQITYETKVVLIKVDVEGHEVRVLRGAAQTIAKHKPNLLVEVLSADARLAVWGVLSEWGYVEANVYDGRNRLYVPA